MDDDYIRELFSLAMRLQVCEARIDHALDQGDRDMFRIRAAMWRVIRRRLDELES